MDKRTTATLVALNREFYQTFAPEFSATRRRLQSGVSRVLNVIPPDANLLDLGCGNGELARELAQRGHFNQYVGLDFSTDLLDLARRATAAFANISFIQGDLWSPDWEVQAREIARQKMGKPFFDIILCFAALHHLPGHELRRKTFQRICNLLVPLGLLIHSNWQFLNSERLRSRIQPWEAVGLTPDDVDPGDYLLDWRQGGRGLRYVHHFSEQELHTLAADSGFRVIHSFYSDGEGGNLGLYQFWEKCEAK